MEGGESKGVSYSKELRELQMGRSQIVREEIDIILGDGDSILDENIDEERQSKLHISKLLTYMYYSYILITEEEEEEERQAKEHKKNEIFRLLVANSTLEAREVEMIIELSRRMTGPQPGSKTHKEAISQCIEKARKILRPGHLSKIVEDDIQTLIINIVGSEFFTTIYGPVIGDGSHGDPCPFIEPLKEWLDKNRDTILEEVGIIDENKKYIVKETRLSPRVRLIIRRILAKLKAMHDDMKICSTVLSVDNIYLSRQLDVKLGVTMEKGDEFYKDFRNLKQVMQKILQYAQAPCPKDLAHFMALMDESWNISEKRDMLYFHPSILGEYDVIKRVLLFAVIYNSSDEFSKRKLERALGALNTGVSWTTTIPQNSAYNRFYNKWSKKRIQMHPECNILFFMKDAYSHIHEHVPKRKQCLCTTQKELFALFPTFISEVVDMACHIDVYKGVITLPAVDDIDEKFLAQLVQDEDTSTSGKAVKVEDKESDERWNDREYQCYVGGLKWGTKEPTLEEAFSQFGRVVECRIIYDAEGCSRGFGFVTFTDEQSMREAISNMNGFELDGREITVKESQPRSRRGGGYGGHQGGGSSRGGGGRYGSDGMSHGGFHSGAGRGGRGPQGGGGGGGRSHGGFHSGGDHGGRGPQGGGGGRSHGGSHSGAGRGGRAPQGGGGGRSHGGFHSGGDRGGRGPQGGGGGRMSYGGGGGLRGGR